jgi:hypothetical protein
VARREQLLTVAGSLGIREAAALRIEARERRAHIMTDAQIDEMTNRTKKPFEMEKEYTRLNAKLDIHKWDNKRLPRPGESTKDL